MVLKVLLTVSGGLEKDAVTGAISNGPVTTKMMVCLRREKIERIADDIPLLEVGNTEADTHSSLVGAGTYGHLRRQALPTELNVQPVSLSLVTHLPLHQPHA